VTRNLVICIGEDDEICGVMMSYYVTRNLVICVGEDDEICGVMMSYYVTRNLVICVGEDDEICGVTMRYYVTRNLVICVGEDDETCEVTARWICSWKQSSHFRIWGTDVDATGSEPCPLVGFDISGVSTFGCCCQRVIHIVVEPGLCRLGPDLQSWGPPISNKKFWL
jgi:hypothetical protein